MNNLYTFYKHAILLNLQAILYLHLIEDNQDGMQILKHAYIPKYHNQGFLEMFSRVGEVFVFPTHIAGCMQPTQNHGIQL